MRRMKQLQPQIDAIRAQFSEDRERESKEILELYKRENVTAQSGCLPMVLQLPVFFALYKVLFVAVETRHAPFFGWIKDLSAPDPTRVFNLFGFLPFDPAQVPLIGSFLALGAWPAILGVTVWQLQRKISPTLLGSLQRTAFAALPFLVSLFVAGYAAAWVIFLAWYNLLSSAHQWLLTGRKGGVVGNIPEYSAKVLPYGKIQPIVFLMMLAPVTQNLLMLLVFWRRSATQNAGTARHEDEQRRQLSRP
jgi:YidC/Oxa1 family membrane protein insertase